MTTEISTRDVPLPTTMDQATDAAWLSRALASDLSGSPVTQVEVVETLKTMATKVRFCVTCEDGTSKAYCLKAFLDTDSLTGKAGPTMLHEADFYLKIADHLENRLPECVVAITDRENPQAMIIMRDLVAEGARFCFPHDDFTPDDVAADLKQIALLHSGSHLLASNPWIGRRIERLTKATYIDAEELQGLMDGPRGETLPDDICSGERIMAGLAALAERDARLPQFMVHGDSHAANLFRDETGAPGLIDWQLLQSGGWALDVSYHICATLDVETAATEERELLAGYLETMRAAGLSMPDDETAWRQYREAAAYGYYLHAITRRVEPSVTVKHVERLGGAVARHDSFGLLGV